MTQDETTTSTWDPPGDAPAPTAPVGGRGRSGARWAVALGIVGLVIAATVAAAVLLTGRAPDASVLGWVPADSVVYGEARLDLPGDQRAGLGEFLSKFPGFRDQATLDTKIGEVFDRIVGAATDGRQTYTRDIDPWFEGEVAFGVGPLPDPAIVGPDADPADAAEAARFVLLLSINDADGARAWFEGLLDGATTSTEDYAGTRITLIESGGTDMGGKHGTGAFAVLGSTAAVVGDVASVRAAIDTGGRSPFAEAAPVQAALATATADHVGFLYVDMAAYMTWVSALGERFGEAVPMPMTGMMADLMPDWLAARLRVEGDALVVDMAMPTPEKQLGPTEDRASELARRVPASALLFLDARDYGDVLLDTIELYRSDPELAAGLREVEMAAGMLGGFQGIVGWMGDVGIVVDGAPGGPSGGLVIRPTDQQAAANFLTTIRSFAVLGGSQAGVTIRDETHGAATITIVDLGNAGDLMGGGLPGGPVTEAPIDGTDRLELAWTVTDDLVVLGVGPDFVRRILDTTVDSSLASDERFASLVGRAGERNAGVAFIDIQAAREAFETLLAEEDPADMAEYEREVKPFLLPFDAVIQVNQVEGEHIRSRALITIE
jgi:hypothetical protein